MNYPTMPEYKKAIEAKRDAKIEAMPEPEAINYATQMRLVRDGAKLSGIEQWTEAHTIGALFSASAIRGCFQQLHRMGLLNAKSLAAIEATVLEQEIIIVQMGEP